MEFSHVYFVQQKKGSWNKVYLYSSPFVFKSFVKKKICCAREKLLVSFIQTTANLFSMIVSIDVSWTLKKPVQFSFFRAPRLYKNVKKKSSPLTSVLQEVNFERVCSRPDVVSLCLFSLRIGSYCVRGIFLLQQTCWTIAWLNITTTRRAFLKKNPFFLFYSFHSSLSWATGEPREVLIKRVFYTRPLSTLMKS